MNRIIFSQKIISAGQCIGETGLYDDNKTEDAIPPVTLAVTQSFAVAELWKNRIRQGHPGNDESNL